MGEYVAVMKVCNQILRICVAGFFGLTFSAMAEKEQKVETLAIGAAAPDFELPGTDEKTYTLSSFEEAKYLVVIFTCNHCPDARAARDRINDFAKAYQDKGVQVVAISGNDPEGLMKLELGYSVYGDSFPEMKEVAKEHGYVFPYLYDGDEQLASLAYGAQATPHTFIFGPERKLLYQGHFDDGRRNHGPAENNTVRDNIDTLLAGKSIEEKTTRVFGCSTKWKWKRAWAQKKREEWAAMPVTVETLDLETAKKLAENKTNKVRVINFWSTTCGPCVVEFPDLVDAYERYQLRNFDIVTISIDPEDKTAQVQKFLDDQNLPLAPATKASVEKEGRKTNNYQYTGKDLDALAEAIDPEWDGPLPHTVIIAPGGEIVWRHTNQIDPIAFRRAIMVELDKQ